MTIHTNAKSLRWTIIGGGNGGQSVAGHLALMGFTVHLYDIVPESIEAIHHQGGIYLEGEVKGFGKLASATTDITEVVEDADIIMVITPALAHKAIAKSLASQLKDDQIVILHPGATFGSLEFKKTLEDENCKADVTIAETNTLIYACRSDRPGTAKILGIKERILLATLPGDRGESVCRLLQQAYPEVCLAENILITSFDNTNPIVHPTPILLNTGTIENNWNWRFYLDGITPKIGAYLEKMDAERIALGEALGLNLWTCKDQYRIEYNVDKETLSEAVRANKAYDEIQGPDHLENRYLIEDIPMGLVPLADLGKSLGIPTPHIDTIIKLGELLLEKDLTTQGRTLENIGLAGMAASEIRHYVETGVKD